jgi:hypothetical protein
MWNINLNGAACSEKARRSSSLGLKLGLIALTGLLFLNNCAGSLGPTLSTDPLIDGCSMGTYSVVDSSGATITSIKGPVQCGEGSFATKSAQRIKWKPSEPGHARARSAMTPGTFPDGSIGGCKVTEIQLEAPRDDITIIKFLARKEAATVSACAKVVQWGKAILGMISGEGKYDAYTTMVDATAATVALALDADANKINAGLDVEVPSSANVADIVRNAPNISDPCTLVRTIPLFGSSISQAGNTVIQTAAQSLCQ